MLNRKFVRTDDAMKDSEETATAFNVSQTIDKRDLSLLSMVKLAITRERSFSLLIHESKSKRTWLEAYRSC